MHRWYVQQYTDVSKPHRTLAIVMLKCMGNT